MSALSSQLPPAGHWDVPWEDIDIVLDALLDIAGAPDAVSVARNASRVARAICRFDTIAVVVPSGTSSADVYGSSAGWGDFELRLALTPEAGARTGSFSGQQVLALLEHVERLGGLAGLAFHRSRELRRGHLRTVAGANGNRDNASHGASLSFAPVSNGREVVGLVCGALPKGQAVDLRRERLLTLFARILAPTMQVCRTALAEIERRAEDKARRTRHGDDMGVVPLSPRESEVLGLLARGLPTREIARALSLRPNTVRSYIQAVLGKLQATNRLMALANARELGLL